MDQTVLRDLFTQTAYIHTGGSVEELRCAEFLQAQCAQLGAEATLEPFTVAMADMHSAHLYADGKEVPCKGFLCSGNADVTAPFFYLPLYDDYALSQCKGKIVLSDAGMSYWNYHDLLDAGAVGFITYDGSVNYADDDIDQKELRGYVSCGKIMPGVNINAKTARRLVENGTQTVRIVLEQTEWEGESRNVVLDLPGETDEWIILTAHYDTTSLSVGSYDNMTGSVGLLGIAESFIGKPHHYGLRFVWCGSEERGLLGSKAYVKAHEEELSKVVLNINLDMIGSTMGKFIACCSAEEKLVHYIEYMANEQGFPVSAYTGVYSSDSTPFADKNVPSLSFARASGAATGTIHNRYDTIAILSMAQMEQDIAFLTAFTERMACAKRCPVKREIPADVKEKLDVYLSRKRPEKK